MTSKTNKGGRPTKSLTPEQIAQVEALVEEKRVLRLSDARSIQVPVIYGLCTKDGDIFYVGKTVNPKKRFYTHEKEHQSYNPDLAKIEKEYVIILESNPSNISESEKKFIKKYRKKIVNSSVASKYEHGKGAKPWSIGQGKITPSKMLLRILATEDPCSANKIRKEIRSMTEAQRCAFETSIFMHAHVLMKSRLAEWYNSCRDKMLKCMTDSYGEVK